MNDDTDLLAADDALAAALLPAAFEPATDEHASDYASNDIGLALRVQALAGHS